MATRYIPLGDLYINSEHISAIRAKSDGDRIVHLTIFLLNGSTFEFEGEDALKAFVLLKSSLA